MQSKKHELAVASAESAKLEDLSKNIKTKLEAENAKFQRLTARFTKCNVYTGYVGRMGRLLEGGPDAMERLVGVTRSPI